MYELLERLFPLTRSITGNGVRGTLKILQKYIPINIVEVKSGTQVFDWVVPDEWNINDAYVLNEYDERVIDFNKSNLHVVGYSIPFEGRMELAELKEHLHTLPDQPDLIPYITSYYKRQWGFCLSHNQYKSLTDGSYFVKIDSTLMPGSLTYGELLIQGRTNKEVLLSTYICHPSMANNELSGPVLATYLAKQILERKSKPYYSYRIIFVPETIGALVYLSQNLAPMKENTIAGYVITCAGDPGKFTYMKTRFENTLTDRVAEHVLKNSNSQYSVVDFILARADERQYNAPGIDLPIGCFMRSMYGTYPEYHTSADNLDYITLESMEKSLEMIQLFVDVIEQNRTYTTTVLGEPQLGRRGLYPSLSQKRQYDSLRNMKNLLSYSDGKHDLLWIADKINCPIWELFPIVDELVEHDILV